MRHLFSRVFDFFGTGSGASSGTISNSILRVHRQPLTALLWKVWVLDS